MENLTLESTMREIEKTLNENPEPIKGMHARYTFQVKGKEEGIYLLQIQDGTASVSDGSEEEADCTLKMSLDNFYKFLDGKLNGTMAFMTGKLKIDGDMTKALKLESLLKQYRTD